MPSGDFDRHAVFGSFVRYIRVADDGWHSESIREGSAERGIRIGVFTANVVMQMREASQHQLAPLSELPQDEEHRHRVGSSRHRGQQTRFWSPERMPHGVPADVVKQ
jgi:hypothetical protein